MDYHPPSDEPLLELKHEAVPGYLKAFLIAFAVMGFYLLVILVSSPGPAEHEAKAGASHNASH